MSTSLRLGGAHALTIPSVQTVPEFSVLMTGKAYDLCSLVKYAYDLNLFSLARNTLVSTMAEPDDGK